MMRKISALTKSDPPLAASWTLFRRYYVLSSNEIETKCRIVYEKRA